ncbi:PilZ domain-containing protein [Acidobacteriota bacterium]
MDSKRREKRFKEENRVVIHYAQENKDSVEYSETNAATHDISLGGARIQVDKLFPVDSIIRIQISLSRSGEAIKVDGKVKWINKIQDEDLYEIGVEFLHHISKTVLSLIRHLYAEDTGVPTSVS